MSESGLGERLLRLGLVALAFVLPLIALTGIVFVVGWKAKFVLVHLLLDTLFALVFLAAAAMFLLRRLLGWRWIAASGGAAAYALLLVLGVPTIHEWLHPRDEPAAQHPIVTAIDLLIVSPTRGIFLSSGGLSASRIQPPPEDVHRWHTSYSLATVSAARNPLSFPTQQLVKVDARYLDRRTALEQLAQSALVTGSSARSVSVTPGSLEPRLRLWAPRQDTKGAVILNVDGLAPFDLGIGPRHRIRPLAWSGEALNKISGLGVPVYPILAGDDERIGWWRTWATRTGGDAARLPETRRYVLTDAALRLATERRATLGDYGLAWRYRPHLWFDEAEKFKRPVDVDALLTSGQVWLCKNEFPGGDRDCEQLTDDHPLKTDYGFLRLPRPADLVALEDSLPSTMYYHVDRPTEPGSPRPPGAAERLADDDRVYIDYWWYFPYNPTPLRGGFCGPGFATDGWTCFDHESDWEGLTVTLRPSGARLVPAAVTYAQHDVGVSYRWLDAVKKWDASGKYVADHPLVYVATSSHASYADPCPGRPCDQVQHGTVRKDGPHGGDEDWSLNHEEACDPGLCLKEVPLDAQGAPALWNAFRGPWGRRHCLWRFPICDIGTAPNSPAFQHRYERPWQAASDGKWTTLNGTRVRVGKY